MNETVLIGCTLCGTSFDTVKLFHCMQCFLLPSVTSCVGGHFRGNSFLDRIKSFQYLCTQIMALSILRHRTKSLAAIFVLGSVCQWSYGRWICHAVMLVASKACVAIYVMHIIRHRLATLYGCSTWSAYRTVTNWLRRYLLHRSFVLHCLVIIIYSKPLTRNTGQ